MRQSVRAFAKATHLGLTITDAATALGGCYGINLPGTQIVGPNLFGPVSKIRSDNPQLPITVLRIGWAACRLALSLRSPTGVAPIVGLRASAQPTGMFREYIAPCEIKYRHTCPPQGDTELQ